MLRHRLALWLMATVAISPALLAATPEELLEGLRAQIPQTLLGWQRLDLPQFIRRAEDLEIAAAQLAGLEAPRTVDLADLDRLLAVKQDIDSLLQLAMARRSAPPAADAEQLRKAVRHFLAAAAALTDLSGKLRYQLVDAIADAAAEAADTPAAQGALLALLSRRRSTVGAAVMSDLLFEPPAESPSAGRIPSAGTRRQVLELIAASRQTDLVDELAAFLRSRQVDSELALAAAETLLAVGVPQDAGPGHDPTLPKVSITVAEIRALLQATSAARLSPELVERREALLSQLARLAERGLGDGSPEELKYRYGSLEVRPGDWLLMRNPSPYNLFTDLSPGLFTHVGIVTDERGSDGRSRMVVVDLPERGKRIPATNFDTFVKRTRHWVLLRHRDPVVQAALADAARSLIGNECCFDMNFRTDRLAELAGVDLAGKKIHTYCAGLLLLCALQTGRPREEFFPLAEGPAGGHTVENLEKLGLTFGKDFISPSGALFSTQMELVGGREPMYEPRRQIEEAAYEHFAQRLADRSLSLAPTMFQSLRLKVAGTAKTNPLLAQALASAANVDADIDLVAAARAAAVIETLDEIATGASSEYFAASQAVRSVEDARTPLRGRRRVAAANAAGGTDYRQRHRQLASRWQREEISPRQLRLALVAYYSDQARRALDARFFEPAKR